MFELMLNKLDGIDGRLDGIDERLVKLESNQKTILEFVSNADDEFKKLDENSKVVDKLKKVINISAII